MKNKVKLGDLVNIKTGKLDANAAVNNGKYPFFTTSEEIFKIDIYAYDDEAVLVAGNGNLNVKYFYGKFNAYQRTYILTKKVDRKVNMKYIYYFLDKYLNILRSLSIGGVIKYIKLENLVNPIFYLPTIEIQNKIVKKLDSLKEILDIQKKKLDLLSDLNKSLFTRMFGDLKTNDKNWEMSCWKEVLNIKNGRNQKQVEDINGKYPIYGSGGIIGYSNAYICNENTIIIGRKGNINKPILVKEKFWNVDTAFGLEPMKNRISYYYLYHFCSFYNFEVHNKAVTIPSLVKSDLEKILIPIPPIELQNKFADRVEKIEKLSFEIEKSIEEAENLYNSLMNKYFD
ncbi:restriction endonuclease subunit S [Fusobacterium russii]|uniref:restriction endonuclease subunit S n=1 Tax=Fusobacterium russii TaxID=854 RepID=UPI0003A60BC0|nr:restriction endonuclease subunit S [Fusobacterium russii]